MNRRTFLAACGAAGATSLAGCARRVTGWSDLRMRLRNAADRPVGLRVTVDVTDDRAYARTFELDAGGERAVGLPFDVPWGASLRFRAERVDTGAVATARWAAEVPLWGGNPCAIEPFVTARNGSVELGPTCP